jgi:uncharacterized protein YndB with AHSA1/START domain
MRLDVEFARLIDAPPEQVFEAFTDPEGQEAFYGQGDPGWIVQSQCDLRTRVDARARRRRRLRG